MNDDEMETLTESSEPDSLPPISKAEMSFPSSIQNEIITLE
jgi:hypothetical protein